MIEPYTAVALSPIQTGAESREDYLRNIEDIKAYMDVAYGIASTDGPPVKLMVLPEASFQVMLPGYQGGDHDFEKRMCIELPGPETEALAEKARELNTFIAADAILCRDEDFPDRYFNRAFIIDPKGELIYTRSKLQVEPLEPEVAGTTVPHDVWDRWIELKGNGNAMDALYPVADTEIGRIGMIVCMEGGYPEIGRGLALNGAEIITRQTYHEPYVANGWWELQNRSFAMHNNAYVIAPNLGPQRATPDSPLMDIGGGKSMIVDYRGSVMVQREFAAANTAVHEYIDVEALRRYRNQNGFGRWFKDLRQEQFAVIYERPIYPKNQWLDAIPETGWGEREAGVLAQNIEELQRQGVLVAPAGAEAANGEQGANGGLQQAVEQEAALKA